MAVGTMSRDEFVRMLDADGFWIGEESPTPEAIEQAKFETKNEVAALDQFIAENPNDAEAHYYLGLNLLLLARPDEAEEHLQIARNLNPKSPEVTYNLAAVAAASFDHDRADILFDEAIKLRPAFSEAWGAKGMSHFFAARWQQSLESYDRAIAIAPTAPYLHGWRAETKGITGDLAGAWSDQRAELSLRLVSPLSEFPMHLRWQGAEESIVGKTFLLRGVAQGHGDTFHFIRYADSLKRLGADQVIVLCREAVHSVLRGVQGIDRLVGENDELPWFDLHGQMMSMPALFNSTFDSMRAEPYIHADSKLIEHWRERLANIPGFRIGINWRGGCPVGNAALRDFPLRLAEGLAIPGTQLINLHQGIGKADLRSDSPIYDFGHIDSDGAFTDTAAIIKNLDLVITSDTAIAHLAGALGSPVWLALPFVPDWRWFLNRTDSPWYPTMRLFRQQKFGDWDRVFAEMAAELGRLVRTGGEE